MTLRKKSAQPALLASFAVSSLAVTSPVLAQVGGKGLEEVIVTAQRRIERLENVPMAITALSPEALEKASIVNIRDISRITPGVEINNGGAYMQPSIRGITALTNGNGNENNVAFYVDGFFVSDNSSIDTDLANISSIQVLKGPQGTLYGRQAAGGAILINTVDPT
jgi:iron complex outermembrane receptor protein